MSAMAITTRVYSVGSVEAEELPLEEAADRLDEGSIVWVDTDRDEASLAAVGERLGLGDAIRSLVSAPREGAAFREDVIRLSVTGLRDSPGDAAAVRLDLLLARNVVVSVHADPIRGLSDPIDTVAQDPRFGRLDAGRFGGLLLDGILDGYDAAVEELERDIDRLDEAALRREQRDDVLETMVALRRRIAALRRWLAPSRAVFAALTRPIDDEPSPIGAPDVVLVAHVDRTLDSIEKCRGQLLGSFDIVMTRTSQRTNDVMRILTVISAVLLPSVVIAGVMGMNFQAELFDEPQLFYVVVGAMIALAVLTLAFARWRRWV
jgi:magnesium transporter